MASFIALIAFGFAIFRGYELYISNTIVLDIEDEDEDEELPFGSRLVPTICEPPFLPKRLAMPDFMPPALLFLLQFFCFSLTFVNRTLCNL